MLYHKDTGIPFNINLPTLLGLHYSDHAIRAARNDRYGVVKLESVIDTTTAQVIEVETGAQTGRPIKVLLRKPHDEVTDVCFAIALDRPRQGRLVVKTVWLNLKSDLHRSLNKSRYQQSLPAAS